MSPARGRSGQLGNHPAHTFDVRPFPVDLSAILTPVKRPRALAHPGWDLAGDFLERLCDHVAIAFHAARERGKLRPELEPFHDLFYLHAGIRRAHPIAVRDLGVLQQSAVARQDDAALLLCRPDNFIVARRRVQDVADGASPPRRGER